MLVHSHAVETPEPTGVTLFRDNGRNFSDGIPLSPLSWTNRAQPIPSRADGELHSGIVELVKVVRADTAVPIGSLRTKMRKSRFQAAEQCDLATTTVSIVCCIRPV